MNKYHFPDPIRGKRSKRNYSLVFKRDKDICQYCGDVATTIDHIIPWNFKNNNSPENMVASCKLCNSLGGDKLFRDFNEKKLYILNRRIQKKFGIKNPLQWPDIKIKKDSEFPLADFPVVFVRACKDCKTKFKTDTQSEKEFCSFGCETEYARKEKIKESLIVVKETENRIPCKYCKKLFIPKVEWQKFCCRKHREEYWKQVYGGDEMIKKRLEEIEERIEQLGISK